MLELRLRFLDDRIMSKSGNDMVDIVTYSCPVCSRGRFTFICRSCLLEDKVVCTLLVPENKKVYKQVFPELPTINL